jgi:hypothetical protein
MMVCYCYFEKSFLLDSNKVRYTGKKLERKLYQTRQDNLWQTQIEKTIKNTMKWPGLTQVSQMTKKELNKYGLLPPKRTESDTAFLGHGMCGSCESIYNKDTSQNTLSFSLLVLTMIDPVTGWFEIVEATYESETFIQDLFHNAWLVRYPWPQFIVFDNGWRAKFKREFKQMCDNYGIKAKPTTSQSQHLNWKTIMKI